MNPVVLTSNSSAYGSRFIRDFVFKNGASAPLYEVDNMAAFSQLIGHAKFINSQYGNVYYRGVNGLFDNVLPSILRDREHGDVMGLRHHLTRICNDSFFRKSLKLRDVPSGIDKDTFYLRNEIERKNKYCVEGLLQHYAGNTRFLDVVDNHWVALWMGLQSFVMLGKGSKFCKCEERKLLIGDYYQALETSSCAAVASKSLREDIYEYVLLMAMPYPQINPQCGIIETDDFVEVDLRKTLPSFYLRPHAQHALVIRRRDKGSKPLASDYDMASQVIAILRIRIDRAALWLGNGNLLTAANLFPSPSLDQGYFNLLQHPDLFDAPFDIVKYF